MAEFVEVIRKKAEMCESYIYCYMCPLNKKCSTDYSMKYPEEVENIILNWEKPVDWSKVKVDTPIIVAESKVMVWLHRVYFAKYEDGKVYAWSYGATSKTADSINDCYAWNYAMLSEEAQNK